MYYVYVLQSELNGQSYVGSTNNLKSRFEQHNDGKIMPTKRYMPWKLIYYEAYESEKLTRMREKRLKYNGNAIRELKKRIGFSTINSVVKFLKSGAGFTLIELLIVVALIGVMAAGIITILNPLLQIQKAQDAKRKGDISQIQKALETYYQDNGRYPVATSFRLTRLDGSTADWGFSYQPYMSILPKDPSSSKNYVYNNASLDGQTYYIYASLDRGINDPQICHSDGTPCSSLPVGASCGAGAICNYGASSPNVSP